MSLRRPDRAHDVGNSVRIAGHFWCHGADGGVRPEPGVVAGLPWPAVDVYQYIDARPEQAAAVFIDYGLHRTYIPGVRESRVSAIVDPSTVEVDYVVAVPIVSDERYTIRNHVCTCHGGASYGVDWTHVRAGSTKATIGHVRFDQHVDARLGKRGTVMAYSNVDAGDSRGIVRRVAAEQATDRALLEKQIGVLRAALEPQRSDSP